MSHVCRQPGPVRGRTGPGWRLFFGTRKAAEDHLYRGERERAGQAAPQAPPVKQLRRAMAEPTPTAAARPSSSSKRRYQAALELTVRGRRGNR
jgi:hypothetical protein